MWTMILNVDYNFECGLCGYFGNDLENLELHQFTCEKFTCTHCDLTFKNIGEVKSHLSQEHPK